MALWLLMLVVPASAAPRPADALAADAAGLSVSASVLATVPVQVGPLPAVDVYLPPQSDLRREAVVDLAPVPGLIDRAAVLEVTAGGSLDAGRATATAETVGLSLFDGQIKADVLKGVSVSDCDLAVARTPEAASAGSQVVGLELGGQPIALPIGPNELRVRLAVGPLGIADVRVYDVVPDGDGYGWTTRMLHVFLLDPVTQVVNAEVIVSEAHTSAVCGLDEPTSGGDNTLLISKRAVPGQVQPGQTVDYDITIRNQGEEACRVFKVIDRLPPGFSFEGSSGTLADVDPTVSGRDVTWHNLAGWVVAPGEALTGRLTVRVGADVAPGTYYNDVIAHSTCGKFQKGQDGRVDVVPIGPGPSAPAPDPASGPGQSIATGSRGPLPATGPVGTSAGVALAMMGAGLVLLRARRAAAPV